VILAKERVGSFGSGLSRMAPGTDRRDVIYMCSVYPSRSEALVSWARCCPPMARIAPKQRRAERREAPDFVVGGLADVVNNLVLDLESFPGQDCWRPIPLTMRLTNGPLIFSGPVHSWILVPVQRPWRFSRLLQRSLFRQE